MKPWAYYFINDPWRWICAKPECLVIAHLEGKHLRPVSVTHWLDNVDKCLYCQEYINKPREAL